VRVTGESNPPEWTIVYAATIETVPQLASLEPLLLQIAENLITNIAADSAGWHLPFLLQVEGWNIEYRVDPAQRRIIVADARPAPA
jgi:hypothetical protein